MLLTHVVDGPIRRGIRLALILSRLGPVAVPTLHSIPRR